MFCQIRKLFNQICNLANKDIALPGNGVAKLNLASKKWLAQSFFGQRRRSFERGKAKVSLATLLILLTRLEKSCPINLRDRRLGYRRGFHRLLGFRPDRRHGFPPAAGELACPAPVPATGTDPLPGRGRLCKTVAGNTSHYQAARGHRRVKCTNSQCHQRQ